MKPVQPLGIVAQAWYPSTRQTAAEAVAAGDVTAKVAADLGYTALPVAPDMAPPDMAVAAARHLLTRAALDASELDLVLHASVHHQGHDAWSPPHYIADRIGADRAIPIGLLQQCNGGAIGIDLAATRHLAGPAPRPCLITTADRFLPPSWHRWKADYGMATGDAGTAVVVRRHRDGDDLLLHSMSTSVAP